jgi:hypothetical protein
MHAYIYKIHVYEIYAAISAHIEGIRLGDTSVRACLPVNMYEIYGNFDFRERVNR